MCVYVFYRYVIVTYELIYIDYIFRGVEMLFHFAKINSCE